MPIGPLWAAYWPYVDRLGDGQIDEEEFRIVLANEQVRFWLNAQGLDTSDGDKLKPYAIVGSYKGPIGNHRAPQGPRGPF